MDEYTRAEAERPVPRNLSESQMAIRAKYYNDQKAAKKRIEDRWKDGDKFTFPANMRGQVQYENTAGEHEAAGMPGIYHGCRIISRMWMVSLEIIFPDRKPKFINIGVKRVAIILGVDEGIC